MAKEDITGGLLLAVQKGESLEQAMLSFFNAGYKREEIEGAARELQTLPDYPVQTKRPQPKPKFSLNPLPKLKKLPQTPQVKSPTKLKPISPTILKKAQPSPSKKILQESAIKEPLSLSRPTPKLHEDSIQPPKPVPPQLEPSIPKSQPEIYQQPLVDSFQEPILPTPQPISPQPVQNSLDSNYGKKGPNPKSVMIWVLSALLISLVLFLGIVFLFRNSLIDFFNKLV